MTKPLVFVSYAHAEPAESALAGLIADRLRRDGAEVFIDQGLKTGQDWNAEIERRLDACDAFCPLLSTTSVASPMVQAEIERVGERRRRHGAPEIWPVRCRYDGRLLYDLDAHLRRIQYLTWQGDADTALALDELLDRFRELRDGPQPEPPPPALCTLPGRIADFTGREPEIADLIAALCREDRRAAVSAIGGMGGAGKTTLAIEAAWRMAGRFPDGILYIDMLGFGTAPPLTPAQASSAVIEQLEPTAKPPERLDQLLPLYRRLLAGRRVLLLLDNARDTAQVADLVPPPPVALLVTSRHQMFLDGATRLNLDVMPANEARTLLRGIVGDRRASDADLRWQGRCGWLPLALRAAGAYLQFRTGLKVADYLELLAAEHTRLDHLKVPQAIRDVRATLNLSATLLDTDDPGLAARWRQLAVFPSAFRPDAAAAVWGEVESEAAEPLDRLVARSLLGFERETERYRLHDLVRVTASEGLATRARVEAECRHAGHYCALLSRAHDLYLFGGDDMLACLALYDEERTNIAIGHTWASAHLNTHDYAPFLTYAYTDVGVYILNLRLPARERIAWLAHAVAACQVLSNRRGEGVSLGNLGNAWVALGQARKAITFLEQSLAIMREIGDRLGEGISLGNLGNAWRDLGEILKAINFYEQELSIARETGNRRGEGNSLGSLGTAWFILGEPRRAIGLQEQRLAIAHEIGDWREEGNALGDLGIAWAGLGEPHKAIQFCEESLAIAREIGDRNGEGNALRNLGIAWADLGEPRKVIEFCEQDLAITRAIGIRREEGRALWNLALAHDSLGDSAEAIRCACKSLVLHKQTDDPFTPEVKTWLRDRGVDLDAVGERL